MHVPSYTWTPEVSGFPFRYSLYRVTPDTEKKAEFLHSLEEDPQGHDVSVCDTLGGYSMQSRSYCRSKSGATAMLNRLSIYCSDPPRETPF